MCFLFTLWRMNKINQSINHTAGCHQGWGQVQLTKYSSTPNIYQVQVLVKYSFFKKYLSTSSTFISSTSTSTHIKICSNVRMDIQSTIYFGWTKLKGFPQIISAQVKMVIFYAELILGGQIKGSFPKIMFLFKSQDGHILCRINLEWTTYRGVISWSGYMYYSLSEYVLHHLKR